MAESKIPQTVIEGLPQGAQTAINAGDYLSAVDVARQMRGSVADELLAAAAAQMAGIVPNGWVLTFENYRGRVRAVCSKK